MLHRPRSGHTVSTSRERGCRHIGPRRLYPWSARAGCQRSRTRCSLGRKTLAESNGVGLSGNVGEAGNGGGAKGPLSGLPLRSSVPGARLPRSVLRLASRKPPGFDPLMLRKVFIPSRLYAIEKPPRNTVLPPSPKTRFNQAFCQLGL